MMTAKDIGKRAKSARKRAKLKQQDVADRMGVEKGTVSRWETGYTEIPLSVLIKLAHHYGCSPYAILLDPPDPQTAAEQEQAL
jgi:transcriptional regulator with XRE-family HTH domain